MDLARRQRIFSLALPIIGGMVSQNLLNIVDTAMVGFLGDAALAAVGLGGFIVFMCQALILGISTGSAGCAIRFATNDGESHLSLCCGFATNGWKFRLFELKKA